MSRTRTHRGRLLTLAAAVGVVAVAAVAAARWEQVATRYYLYRLESDEGYLPDSLMRPEGSTARVALVKFLETEEGKQALFKNPAHVGQILKQPRESNACVVLTRYLETERGKQALFLPVLRHALSLVPREKVTPQPSSRINFRQDVQGTIYLRTGVPEEGFLSPYERIEGEELDELLALVSRTCEVLETSQIRTKLSSPAHPDCSFDVSAWRTERGSSVLRVFVRVFPVEDTADLRHAP